jgi:AraC-like DNA-binding protein
LSLLDGDMFSLEFHQCAWPEHLRLTRMNWTGSVGINDFQEREKIFVVDSRAGAYGFSYDDVDHRIRTGGVAILPTEVEYASQRHDLKSRLLHVDRALVQQAAAIVTGSSKTVEFTGFSPVSVPAKRKYLRLAAFIETYARDAENSNNPFEVLAYARAAAMTVLHTFPNTAMIHDVVPRDQIGSHALERALDYAHEHLMVPFGVRDLARAARCSDRALNDLFVRSFDMPPMRYVRDLRMHEAHDELRRAKFGEATVAAIARRWGFTNPGTFAIEYRKKFGVPPSDTLRRKVTREY